MHLNCWAFLIRTEVWDVVRDLLIFSDADKFRSPILRMESSVGKGCKETVENGNNDEVEGGRSTGSEGVHVFSRVWGNENF